MKNYNRNFNLMIIGQIISIFGSAILRFALSTYILDTTGRADLFAALLAVSTIPGIILTPIGGVIADRFNRRNLMVIFDFINSGIVFAFLLTILFADATIVTIGFLMVVLFIISAMYQPSVQASIPSLVKEDQLAQANGLVNGINALSNFMAPALGGVLYGIIGLQSIVVISAVAFLFSAIMEIFIHIPFVKPEQSGSFLSVAKDDMKKGFQYAVKENKYILKAVGLAAGLNLFLSPFFIVGAPYILRITMESTDMMYGIGLAAIQLSSIIGAIMIGVVAKKLKISNLYILLIIAAILFIPIVVAVMPNVLATGYWPSFTLFMLGSVPILMLMTIVSIYVITVVQQETPNHLLGKVMAIILTISQCAAPIGQLVYGSLFETFSMEVYIPAIGAAVFTFILGVIAKVILADKNEVEAVVAPEAA